MHRRRPRSEAPGLAARRVAADILDGVLRRSRPLDEQLDGAAADAGSPRSPSATARWRARIVATVLRRLGTLRHLLGRFLERGLPAEAPRVETALLLGAAQILLLDVPDHAAVDLVGAARAGRPRAPRAIAGLVNAVLRRVAREGAATLARARHRRARHAGLADGALDAAPTAPRPRARSRARNGHEPALDLTVKDDAAALGRRARRPRAADRHGAR